MGGYEVCTARSTTSGLRVPLNLGIMICITRYMSVCFYIDSRIGASSPLSERRRDLQLPPQVDGVALPSEP